MLENQSFRLTGKLDYDGKKFLLEYMKIYKKVEEPSDQWKEAERTKGKLTITKLRSCYGKKSILTEPLLLAGCNEGNYINFDEFYEVF